MEDISMTNLIKRTDSIIILEQLWIVAENQFTPIRSYKRIIISEKSINHVIRLKTKMRLEQAYTNKNCK
jgi:hypothetical protein